MARLIVHVTVIVHVGYLVKLTDYVGGGVMIGVVMAAINIIIVVVIYLMKKKR